MLGAVTALMAGRPAFGQLGLSGQPRSTAFIQEQATRDEESRIAAEQSLPMTQRLAFDWGGWFDWYVFDFDDGIKQRVEWTYYMRFWAAMRADEGIHEAYARMVLGWDDWQSGTSYTGYDNRFTKPLMERAWYQLDVTKALKKYGNVNSPLSLKTKIGRDLVNIGTGYAISIPLDHVQVQAEWQSLQTTFIVGKTPGSIPNIDQSYPVQTHPDRVFWIIEERYKGTQHEPFVYWATQADHTGEHPINLLQNYNYDSSYVGFGSTGQIIPNLKYNSEWVFERGDSYGDQKFLHRNEIYAWAFDQELDYLFSHPMQPRISFEYMFASGDTTRYGSPTNAAGGVTKGHHDNSFVGFGFRDTGLSYSPRLSNIHIWRFGGSFLPLAEVEYFKNLELGTNIFIYAKNRENAAVSDPLATENSGYLGWETDYYMNYRITSDLAWTVRFGTFFPGAAYQNENCRPFLLSGVTWSF